MTQTVETQLAAKFRRLADEWRADTAYLSFMQQRAMHPAYQRIIGMGPEVVPLLLEELKLNPDDWFWALNAITEENPIPRESEGRFHEMCEAWIEWGRQRGLVD